MENGARVRAPEMSNHCFFVSGGKCKFASHFNIFGLIGRCKNLKTLSITERCFDKNCPTFGINIKSVGFQLRSVSRNNEQN